MEGFGKALAGGKDELLSAPDLSMMSQDRVIPREDEQICGRLL